MTVEEQDAILNKMPSLDSMGKAACYLLLDSQQMAEFYINKFTEQERTFFKSLPIYTFYNDAKHWKLGIIMDAIYFSDSIGETVPS